LYSRITSIIFEAMASPVWDSSMPLNPITILFSLYLLSM
jgi:hypothetical protein